ncbi:hypothetical protein C8J56DRAFT_897423 [Mycena floridula]|nr:hypothetical protein C8J56DRAFT_897423 [Mycena floridula]
MDLSTWLKISGSPPFLPFPLMPNGSEYYSAYHDSELDERDKPSRDHHGSSPYRGHRGARGGRGGGHNRGKRQIHPQSSSSREDPENRKTDAEWETVGLDLTPTDSFEDMMEMDLERFVPTLTFPTTADEAKELIELADDSSLRCVDAWTPGIAAAAEYILESNNPGYTCKPPREHEHIRVEVPHIEKCLLPSGVIRTTKSSTKPAKSKTESASPKPKEIASVVEMVKYNDPNILPSYDSVPNMLRYLAQTDKRMYGVAIDQGRIVVRSVCGAMLINSRLPFGDGFGMPTNEFDIAFIYVCAFIIAKPGRYVEILNEENFGIRPSLAERTCFPSTNFSDYTPPTVAKFFASQGIMPNKFDDAFVWMARVMKKMTWEIKGNPILASLFLSIHQESSIIVDSKEIPDGLSDYGEYYPMAIRDPEDKREPRYPRTPGISKAQKTKPGDVDNSNELASATSISLNIKDEPTHMEVELTFTHPIMSGISSPAAVLATMGRLGYAFTMTFPELEPLPAVRSTGSIPTFRSTSPITPIYSPTGMHAPVDNNIHKNHGVDPKAIMIAPPDSNANPESEASEVDFGEDDIEGSTLNEPAPMMTED